jgi:hypothetical protein
MGVDLTPDTSYVSNIDCLRHRIMSRENNIDVIVYCGMLLRIKSDEKCELILT